MNELFFKINLNKYGDLKQKAESEKRVFQYTLIGYILVIVIMTGFVIGFNIDLQTKIDSRSKLLNEIRNEIETYEISGEFLTKLDLERMAIISRERIFWAKKLVALSEKTTDKIAITNFSFKGNNLSLYGITKVDKNQKEFDLIDNFITELKNNVHINTDFPEITFVLSRLDYEKDIEILRFQIDLISESSEKGR
ncbi:MAG: hypothetical protein P9M11_08265 [Candidatus Tenebribacter burtonii]|jgi:hypothetical protein|nr:hypothetical protein [Candidatus Tenebribacter burtonii]